ncbi:MAG TPA: glycosyltransferase, partial [Saprospiraceae bacterium]|nr:glycosyltransferase [Saprospiraceae bacterium]
FVFPSHYEGFSGALIEAALAGVPVIASDIPMNKEVIPEGYASFFEVKKKESILDSLVYFAENTEECFPKAEKARSYATQNFDIETIASQHEKAYDEFLKNAGKL